MRCATLLFHVCQMAALVFESRQKGAKLQVEISLLAFRAVITGIEFFCMFFLPLFSELYASFPVW